MVHALIIHTAFDFLALLLALCSGWLTYRWRFRHDLQQTAASINGLYFVCLSLGSITGAYFFGTLNLHISGVPGFGRSILGALAGAILMVELYKLLYGTKGSTGYIYIIPFCISVIIGRLGCFFSGLEDNTHGIPTGSSWGWDYGDRILRHPVQIYESLSMVAFVVFALITLKYSPNLIIKKGFYFCVGFYATQRFAWEFFKPYEPIIGQLNTFQYLCIAIVTYSVFMVRRETRVYRTA